MDSTSTLLAGSKTSGHLQRIANRGRFACRFGKGDYGDTVEWEEGFVGE